MLKLLTSLTTFLIAISLGACNSVTLPSLCSETSACLSLSIAAASTTSESKLSTAMTSSLTQPASSDQSHPKLELNWAKPMLLSKNQQLVKLSASQDNRIYQEQGYQLENDQIIQGMSIEATQGHHTLLRSQALWTMSQGAGVTVAVIDSGVDPQHESLQGALLPGFDFVANSPLMQDPNGHGTAVASLIAGRNNVYGLAPQAKILPLRVLNEYNTGSLFDLRQAILFAADLLPEKPNPYPAQVINLSVGAGFYSSTLHEAIKRVVAKGVLVVAAAGNSGREGLSYPAAYNEVIAVGAAELVSGEWRRLAFSSYGQGLTLLAPLGGSAFTHEGRYGESLLLTAETGTVSGTRRFGGTSAVTPLVSGLIALMLALDTDSHQILPILSSSSLDLDSPYWDKNTGYGVINPVASLRAARAISQSGTIAVQILDAESLQEFTFHIGDNEQFLLLEPGNYRLMIWEDTNGDGLHQKEEAFQEVKKVVCATAGKITELELSLHNSPESAL